MAEQFEQVWAELRKALEVQPHCTEHPEFPCVRTLSNEVPNDVLQVDESGILLRSHHANSKGERRIPVSRFKVWWKHLVQYGWASLEPGDTENRNRSNPSNPDRMDSKVIGAIWARCLPEKIKVTGKDEIRLVQAPAASGSMSAEVVESPGLIEGDVIHKMVKAYERNPKAKKQCLAHHGKDCSVCGLNFVAVYGKVGEDCIHVHHLRPLSVIGKEYVVDPIEDLRPVCPNCHAILHVGGKCRTIEEVKELLKQLHCVEN